MDDDFWFAQRYDDLIFDEHMKGHPHSDSAACPWCAADRNKETS